MNRYTILYMYIFLLILATGTVNSQNLVYVKADAAGFNDGTSWTDAYRSLNQALLASRPGDTIFVASGIYKPDEGPGIAKGDRNASFNIKNGVVLMGGYIGTEDFQSLSLRWNIHTRDWQNNRTILTGDLAGNDPIVIMPNDVMLEDNSFHILSAANVDSTTEINGFYIMQGNASGSNESSTGGGLAVYNSSLNIKNCIFQANNAVGTGGAVYSRDSNLKLKFVSFLYNYSWMGGAAALSGNNSKESVFLNCFFNQNTGLDAAGAVFLTAQANCSLINSVFTNNATANAASRGGALHADNTSYPSLLNCTFYNNSAVAYGGAVSISAAKIYNSILWNDNAPTGKEIYFSGTPENSGAPIEIWNNDIEGGFAGERIFNIDPGFIQPGNPVGNDSFPGTPDDGLKLSSSSPLLDSGIVSLNSYESDITGLPREAFAEIDLGAYERQRYDLSYRDIFNMLREGGHVLLFNNVKSDPTRRDDPYFDYPQDINDSVFIYAIHDTSRLQNPTPEGLQQGRYIGHIIKVLGLMCDTIIASPIYRAKVTARELFGISSYLTSYAWMWADPIYTNSKKSRLGTIKSPGKNTVLVSHQNNIEEITSFKKGVVREGDMILIQPQGGRNYTELTHITTDTWDKLVPFIYRTTGVNDEASAPSGYYLSDNYPNPFNPETNIEFAIPSDDMVTIKLYNIVGEEAATILNQFMHKGKYNIKISGGSLSSGVYFYELNTGSYRQVKKMVLMR